MTKLKKWIVKAKKFTKLSERYDKKSDILRDKVWNELELKYALVLNKEVKQNFVWDRTRYDGKIRTLLRSLVKRETIVRISSEIRTEGFFLTQKYGLKTPRTQHSHDFIPWNISYDDINLINFKKGHWRSRHQHIPFIELKNNKDVNSKNLRKLFYFLREILKIAKDFQRIEKNFKRDFKDLDDLKRLNDYSDIKEFSEFIKNESKFIEPYNVYQIKLQEFKIKQEKLEKELKEYNKPFRILLTLKEEPIKSYF